MKALISVGREIFDVTGRVQIVEAHKGGELVYRGNGLCIFRPNHIEGNKVVFISFVSNKYIFGEFVNTYAAAEGWSDLDYAKFDMKADETKLVLENVLL